MRKRSYTTACKLDARSLDTEEELQKLKMEFSIFKQKYDELIAQRDILKQGNSKLINEFLFDKSREDMNRMSDLLKQKTEENNQLKKIIEELYRILQGLNGDRRDSQLITYEHSSNFTIRISDDKRKQNLTGRKTQIDPSLLKQNVLELKSNYDKQHALNKQLEEQNVQLGQEIQFLRASLQQINHELQRTAPEELLKSNEELMQKVEDITLELHSLRDQNSHLTHLLKQNEEQSKFKEKQLNLLNKELSEKIKQLERQVKLRKSNIENTDQRQSNLPLKSTKFNDAEINMSVSICQTEDMKKSIIYEKLSDSCMQQSIVTESYDKRLSKLQKTNASLEKDYKFSQEKIKNLNREYSKLKLDYLKLSEDWKLREDEFERKIDVLNNKLDTANRKIKQEENMVLSVKTEKEREKSTFKSIIFNLESKQAEEENLIEKHKLEIHQLKEQLQQAKKVQEMKILNNSQLQHQKNKNKLLQKELQQKSKDFERTLKEYESMIESMRKINGGGQREDSKQKYFARKDIKSASTINRSSESLISPFKKLNNSSDLNIKIENDVILKALKSEVQMLQSNLKLENQRYNILENSNKELRKQMLKMIDQQEKLRKDLINERIKSKTKSMSSKSRTFSSKRLREDFSEQKKLNQSESHLELTIGTKHQRQNAYQQRNTDRSLDESDRKISSPYNSSSHLVVSNYLQSQTELKNLQGGKNQGSYLKTMRERRFDPKETSSAVPVKQVCSTDRNVQIVPTNQSFTERKNTESRRNSNQVQSNSVKRNKEQSEVSQINSPANTKTQNESYKTPTPTTKKNLNDVNSAQTRTSINAINQIEKKVKMIESISVNPPTKYVYQPPKKYIPNLTMVMSITKENEKEIMGKKINEIIVHEEKEEQLISLSNDNREITLEISSSKSNCSKVDMVIESSVGETGSGETNIRTRSIKEPQSERKIVSPEARDPPKQTINNFNLAGKGQQTKSNGQVRFMRKG